MKKSSRTESPYLKRNEEMEKNKKLKFCVGQCAREYIPKDNILTIYCPSCDRVIAERPIKNPNFKDE